MCEWIRTSRNILACMCFLSDKGIVSSRTTLTTANLIRRVNISSSALCRKLIWKPFINGSFYKLKCNFLFLYVSGLWEMDERYLILWEFWGQLIPRVRALVFYLSGEKNLHPTVMLSEELLDLHHSNPSSTRGINSEI